MRKVNWKRTIIGLLDIVLALYLILAVTSFNKPNETQQVCTKVDINIADSNNAGFLSANEIKNILENHKNLSAQQTDEICRSAED